MTSHVGASCSGVPPDESGDILNTDIAWTGAVSMLAFPFLCSHVTLAHRSGENEKVCHSSTYKIRSRKIQITHHVPKRNQKKKTEGTESKHTDTHLTHTLTLKTLLNKISNGTLQGLTASTLAKHTNPLAFHSYVLLLLLPLLVRCIVFVFVFCVF